MEVLKKIFYVLINKYFLTTVAFVAWMLFFDSNRGCAR